MAYNSSINTNDELSTNRPIHIYSYSDMNRILNTYSTIPNYSMTNSPIPNYSISIPNYSIPNSSIPNYSINNDNTLPPIYSSIDNNVQNNDSIYIEPELPSYQEVQNRNSGDYIDIANRHYLNCKRNYSCTVAIGLLIIVTFILIVIFKSVY